METEKKITKIFIDTFCLDVRQLPLKGKNIENTPTFGSGQTLGFFSCVGLLGFHID